MLDTDTASQGAPQGETAPQPANEQAPGTGTGQTPSAEEQPSPTEPGQPADDKPAKTPWFQRRIDELTRDRWEKQRENETLRAELERARQPRQDGQQQPDPQQRQQPSPADYQRHVREEAQRMQAQAEFDRTCNDIHAEGTKAFPDFDAALGSFRLLGGLPPALVEAAQETGAAAKVLYDLGRDPDEAARILALSPTRMAVAVAKIAARPPTNPPVSKAPPPIQPIGTASKVETDPDKMSAADWMAWRNKQVASR